MKFESVYKYEGSKSEIKALARSYRGSVTVILWFSQLLREAGSPWHSLACSCMAPVCAFVLHSFHSVYVSTFKHFSL